MTGDAREPDNEVGEANDSDRPAIEPADVASRPRPFAAWSSAQQEEGVLAKLGKRISGMFKRTPKDEDVAEESTEGPDLELIEPPSDASEPQLIEPDAPLDLESAAPEPEELIDASSAAAPVEDFEPEASAISDDASAASTATDAADEPVVMWTPDYTPPAADPHELAPLGEEPPTEPMADVSEPAIPEPPKRGFFSRLFGKDKKKTDPEPVYTPVDPMPVVEAPVDETDDAFGEATADSSLSLGMTGEESLADSAEPQAAELESVEPEPAEPQAAEPEFAEPQAAELEPAEQRLPWEDEELVRTDEHEVPAPEEIAVDRSFTSVEDALPADATDAPAQAMLEVPVEEPKRGFFSRLFGRKSKAAVRPSLEIEVHEDRIEAAAHALDEVSGESFATPVGSDADAESFASMDDALPSAPGADAAAAIGGGATEPIDVQAIIGGSATEPIDVQAIIGAQRTESIDVAAVSAEQMRFAPPPAPPEPPAVESRSTLEIEPFDPYAQQDDRDTVETTGDSRSTMEMEREPRSTEEIQLEEEQRQDFSDTLEVEEKTDEFAVPVLDVDVERKTDEFDQLEEGAETEEVVPQTWWQKALRIKPKTIKKKVAAAGATVVEGNPNFLFSKFRAFYNEIIRLKHQKTEFTAGFATAIVTDYAADLSPDAAAASQSQALAQMLELQLAEANWMGGEARERYPDAQYAMACLADEIFTHLEWDGQTAWKNHLLEARLFKTRAADLEVFKRIDKLLKDRPNSHVARDLARVYLLVLAAGFQGKYRPFGLTRALADYRQRLFEYIHHNDALMLYAPERRIFPEAAARTLEGHAVARFSGAQRWAAILILMVLGYTALAHYAWNRVSADLKDVTERIKAASSTSAAPAGTTTANTSRSGGAQ